MPRPAPSTKAEAAPASTPTPPDVRRTEYLQLDSLKFDPRNPKAHDLDTIDASVGRFGVIDPIVLDSRTGQLISGHGRAKTLQAMRKRGESPPDGVRVDPDGSGDWLVPVAVGWASRTDVEASAALIALNRTTELGGWVDDALLDLLDGLSADDGAGLVGVGFTVEDRDALAALAAQSEGEDLSDLIDDTVENPFTGSGEDHAAQVEVKFSMDDEQRDEAMRLLRAIRKDQSLDTLGDALLYAVRKVTEQ